MEKDNKSVSAVEKNTEEKKQETIELEREYIVPLRNEFKQVPRYRRAKRALVALKQFLAKHMKVENRDLKKVKIDMYLNEELWYRGIKNPMHHIKVKAIKKGGIVYAELAEMPAEVKFRKDKIERRGKDVQQIDIKHDAKKVETAEEKKEESEKESAVAEAGFKENKAEASKAKKTQSVKHEHKTQPKRQVLQR